MCDVFNSLQNSATRQGLYCVWVQAREDENARLVAIWIDPAMRAFEPCAKEHPREAAPALAPPLGRTRQGDEHDKQVEDINCSLQSTLTAINIGDIALLRTMSDNLVTLCNKAVRKKK